MVLTQYSSCTEPHFYISAVHGAHTVFFMHPTKHSTHWAPLFPYYHARKCCAWPVGCISVTQTIRLINFTFICPLSHLLTLVRVSFLFFDEFLLLENLCLLTNTLSWMLIIIQDLDHLLNRLIAGVIYTWLYETFFFNLAQQPPVGQVLLIHEVLDHTQWRITFCRTSLDEWSARLRDLYLTTQNTHNRHLCPRWDSNHNLSRWATADLRLRPRGDIKMRK